MPAEPRDATSVIIMRDTARGEGVEILLLRRHAGSDFAGGMHVFPGGVLEESDCEEDMAALCDGISPERAASIIGDAPTPLRALGFFVAGIRETFEETGILLARDSSGELVDLREERSAGLAACREAMIHNPPAFREMLEGEGLKLAADRLRYFAHWVTPEIFSLRFDTRFFLAAVPPFQEVSHDNREITAHLWIAPREALERCNSGRLAMLPPTIVNLMALARFSSVDDALASAEGKDVPVISPRVTMEDGRPRLLLPTDPDSG